MAVSGSPNDLCANTFGVLLLAILLEFFNVLLPFIMDIFVGDDARLIDGCRFILRDTSGN